MIHIINLSNQLKLELYLVTEVQLSNVLDNFQLMNAWSYIVSIDQ